MYWRWPRRIVHAEYRGAEVLRRGPATAGESSDHRFHPLCHFDLQPGLRAFARLIGRVAALGDNAFHSQVWRSPVERDAVLGYGFRNADHLGGMEHRIQHLPAVTERPVEQAVAVEVQDVERVVCDEGSGSGPAAVPTLEAGLQ